MSVEIRCGLCGVVIVDERLFRKIVNGEITRYDRGGLKWINTLSRISGQKVHLEQNRVQQRLRVPIIRHWMKKHKKEAIRICKKEGEKTLAEKTLIIKNRKELDGLGVELFSESGS